MIFFGFLRRLRRVDSRGNCCGKRCARGHIASLRPVLAKFMLHGAIFLPTCVAANVALQVSRKISPVARGE